MEHPASVAVWDFAYQAGIWGMQDGKKSNYFLTQEPASSTYRRIRESAKCGVKVSELDPEVEARGKARPSSGGRFTSKVKSYHRRDSPQIRTYLLSISIPSRFFCMQMKSIISTLLLTPQVHLILLVPQSHIVCPKVCEMMRFPKAAGSGIQILPVPPTIAMECAIAEEDNAFEASLDQIAVEEVAKKVLKCTKVKRFDGYLTFEDERASWLFLEKVGKSVALLAGKK